MLSIALLTHKIEFHQREADFFMELFNDAKAARAPYSTLDYYQQRCEAHIYHRELAKKQLSELEKAPVGHLETK